VEERDFAYTGLRKKRRKDWRGGHVQRKPRKARERDVENVGAPGILI